MPIALGICLFLFNPSIAFGDEPETKFKITCLDLVAECIIETIDVIQEKQEELDRIQAIVDRAHAQLGKPYVWGACGPSSFDCSGLVSYCLSGEYGKRLGTTHTFINWERVSDPQPGDICVNSNHCGVYIGDGQMIHAPHSGDVVKISAVHQGMIFVRY